MMQPFWAPAKPLSTSYFIDVHIDPCKQIIAGTETISIVNRLPVPLKKLALQRGLGKGNAFGLQINGQKPHLRPKPEEADVNAPIMVELSELLEPGESVEIQVDFHGLLVAPQYGALMLKDWHPRLWWGYPTQDDYKVRIDVPQGYEVTASGRTDSKNGHWTGYGVRTFGFVLAKDFERAEAQAGDVVIHSLFTPGGKRCAELLLETAADVINFYRSEFGFYPQPFLSILPGMERPAGGFPFATGIVVIHGQERFDERSQDFWRWITAHEIGHQYWGEYVLEADSPAWLWIALGIYMDREYARARGLDREIHQGFIERYLNGVREGVDTTVERPPEQLAKIGFDHNNIVIHGKGFAIISALESVIGREAFRRIYERCLAEYSGRRLGAHKFQMLCEEETGQDLEWFFSQWVRSNRHLAYQLASIEKTQRNGCHIATVHIERFGSLEMPIPVEGRFADGSIQRKVTDRILVVNEMIFESDAPLMEARLDPEGLLAILESPPKPLELGVSREVSEMRWTKVGEKACQLFNRVKECDLSVANSWGKLGLMLYDGAYYAEALEAFHKAAALSQQGGIWRVAGWVWQGHILDLLGRRDEALIWYRKAEEAKFGGTMRHDQYGIVIDARWMEERLQTPFKRVEARMDV